MNNFRKLLFWEALFVVISLAVWGFALNDNDNVSALAATTVFAVFVIIIIVFTAYTAFAIAFYTAYAAFAASVIASAFAASVVLFFAAVIFALSFEPLPRLRFLPATISVVVEFATIFLLFNYGWPLAAALGILILFGMRLLPEKLIIRPAVADN